MTAPTYPPVLREPIAADAGGSFITNPMPESPTGSNAASIEGGFPPVTMTSELAGGEPPLGQDMNGFLFLLSSHLVYLQSGLPYLFDTDVATALGGYPIGAIVGMNDGTGIWINEVADNMNAPDGSPPGLGGSGWMPLANLGGVTVPGLTGGTVTLNAAQSKKPFINLSGALTSNLTIVLPNTPLSWLIINNTTGAFTTTVANSGGGATVAVPQGGFGSPTGVYSLGIGGIFPSVAPLSIPIDQAPTPSTIVERTNAGYVLATYFNQNSGYENATAIGAVFVENSVADGFLRKVQFASFEAQLLLQNISGVLVNGQVPYSVVQQWAATFFANAALTGVPTAPTAAAGTATSQIATTAFVNAGGSISGNGWRQNPDGTIDQWGTFSTTANAGNVAVSFPRTFPNQLFSLVVGVPFAPSGLGGAGSYQADVSAQSAAGFTYHTVSSSNPAITVSWRAIGK